VDPFGAIEAIIPWEAFVQSVTEAQRLAGAEDFDYLHRISDGYTQIRRYAPAFLNAFRFKAAPTVQAILEAVETLRAMNADNLRKVPAVAPTGFVRKRWETLVFSDAGIDRRFYELCALAELKNALCSGDIWVRGSRQFKDFDEYLIPSERFNALLEAKRLPLVVGTDCEAYLQGRLSRLLYRLASCGCRVLPSVILGRNKVRSPTKGKNEQSSYTFSMPMRSAIAPRIAAAIPPIPKLSP
jgi:hypothetical protein